MTPFQYGRNYSTGVNLLSINNFTIQSYLIGSEILKDSLEGKELSQQIYKMVFDMLDRDHLFDILPYCHRQWAILVLMFAEINIPILVIEYYHCQVVPLFYASFDSTATYYLG